MRLLLSAHFTLSSCKRSENASEAGEGKDCESSPDHMQRSARLLSRRPKLSRRVEEGDPDSPKTRKVGCDKMAWKRGLLLFLAVAVLGGCATIPTGPSVAVFPAPGKPFDVFVADDALCRQWAQRQIGGASPSETFNESAVSGAVLGTMVGAGLGVAIGAATGNAGAGAAIGGATGLVGGTAMGSDAGSMSSYQLQRRYDIAYQQCMYAKGNQIPGSVPVRRSYMPPPPPPPAYSSQETWVTVPGQYVNGKWVPEHRVQVPSGSESGPPSKASP